MFAVAMAVVGIAIAGGAARAQTAPSKPATPAEISDVSRRIAQRNENCRQEATRQHLHLVKRRIFMYQCKKATPL
jgi:hypothetical protein